MQKNKIFIGNLPYSTTKETLVEIFSKYGQITDAYKPDGKGFGFVTFNTDEEAEAAIAGMNEKEIDGRQVFVNISRPKESNGGGRRFNDRRGGGRYNNRDNNDGYGRNRDQY